MCLILNYTYILYICLYPSYTRIDRRRCVTRKFYTLIFILLFFFGKKKIIKWFLLNHWWSLLCQGMGGGTGRGAGATSGRWPSVVRGCSRVPPSPRVPHPLVAPHGAAPGVHCCSPFPSTGGGRSRPGLPDCDGGRRNERGGAGAEPCGGAAPRGSGGRNRGGTKPDRGWGGQKSPGRHQQSPHPLSPSSGAVTAPPIL